MGAITVGEAIFRDADALPVNVNRVLVIGGSGGVGWLALQPLKAKTHAFVIATASRPESRAWCVDMGADLVGDAGGRGEGQLGTAGIPAVDLVLSTANSHGTLPWIANLLRPFGHLSVVDGSPGLDVNLLVPKSVSLHTEMIFSRLLNDYAPETHGAILDQVAAFVAEGQIRPIVTTRLDGLTPETMRAAHSLVERRQMIGKAIIAIR